MRSPNESAPGNSAGPQESAARAFRFAARIAEVRRLLSLIRRDSHGLKDLFLTEQEKRDCGGRIDFLNSRMQSLAFYTLENLKNYQLYGWKKLSETEEENGDGIKSDL